MNDNKPIDIGIADNLPQVGTIWQHKAADDLELVEVTYANELAVRYAVIGGGGGMAILEVFLRDFVLTSLVKANNMVAK